MFIRASMLSAAPFTLIALALAGAARAVDAGKPPTATAELFQEKKIWTIHLKFDPANWSAMEPKGGTNMFDPSAFGMGMFLQPAVLRDGDANKDGKIDAAEFAGLSGRWFADWDRDHDGKVDGAQLRAGLARTLDPSAGDGKRKAPPAGFSLQGAKGKRNGLASILGIEFTHVRADLEFEGAKFENVAVRYKGNGTFVESRAGIKRPLKIDLDKFAKGRKLAGVSTLNLHNNVTDPGMMNEPLAFRCYRETGALAPRTSYARVYVTVPGKYERKYFGLYSIVENVDESFLADRGFPKDAGLFKPSTPDLFADLGDSWEAYDQAYDPKVKLRPEHERRVIGAVRELAGAGDAEFAKRIGDFFDLEETAKFFAATVWMSDFDSILASGQNYFLVLDSRTKKFRFVAWDKDHTFGSWAMRPQEEREQLSIKTPWEGKKPFLERLFTTEAFRQRYLAALADLNKRYPESAVKKMVAELAAAIRPAVAEEGDDKVKRFDLVVAGKPLPAAFFGFGPPTPTILAFVKTRVQSVANQLAGKSEGKAPQPFGAPGGQGAPPPPEAMLERGILKALDADGDKKLTKAELAGGFEKWFASWDAPKRGAITGDQLRRGLNKALPFTFEPPAPPPGDRKKTPPGPAPKASKAN
jgi:hypothetical protein